MNLRCFCICVLVFGIQGWAAAWELEDCGAPREYVFDNPVPTHMLLDMDEHPEIMEQLIDRFPGVAGYLWILDSHDWDCLEDGVRVTVAPDMTNHNGVSGVVMTPDKVRKLMRGEPIRPPEEMEKAGEDGPMCRLPGEPEMWTESTLARLPDDQLIMTITYTRVRRKDGNPFDFETDVLATVQLRLELKQRHAMKMAWTEDRYADRYEVVEILNTVPDRQIAFETWH